MPCGPVRARRSRTKRSAVPTQVASKRRTERFDLQKGLRDRNSPTCTLSQNGYGAGRTVRRQLGAQNVNGRRSATSARRLGGCQHSITHICGVEGAPKTLTHFRHGFRPAPFYTAACPPRSCLQHPTRIRRRGLLRAHVFDEVPARRLGGCQHSITHICGAKGAPKTLTHFRHGFRPAPFYTAACPPRSCLQHPTRIRRRGLLRAHVFDEVRRGSHGRLPPSHLHGCAVPGGSSTCAEFVLRGISAAGKQTTPTVGLEPTTTRLRALRSAD